MSNFCEITLLVSHNTDIQPMKVKVVVLCHRLRLTTANNAY
ncbi:hypothetical protein M23134_00900 [Microscilla marina ATCC 23134]|uniref:Uncharacterized protein n=1 Tax=Microscilla marina ATCC 23134 TaxID=313606 RepID=A1ZZL5_MICM2|nr:hypothetical protein M23134_00900 [Microscilla marina ATCC 23134]